jgi:hypothetical protein
MKTKIVVNTNVRQIKFLIIKVVNWAVTEIIIYRINYKCLTTYAEHLNM